MQLGARWQAGDAPHHSVPELLHGTIAAREADNPNAGSWTLTWLEGRPVCTLDDLVVVKLGLGGEIVVTLRATNGDAPAASIRGEMSEDDDDNWLTE